MNKSSCLSLVSNAILYWNTRRITDIMDHLRQHGEEIAEETWARTPITRCPLTLTLPATTPDRDFPQASDCGPYRTQRPGRGAATKFVAFRSASRDREPLPRLSWGQILWHDVLRPLYRHGAGHGRCRGVTFAAGRRPGGRLRKFVSQNAGQMG